MAGFSLWGTVLPPIVIHVIVWYPSIGLCINAPTVFSD